MVQHTQKLGVAERETKGEAGIRLTRRAAPVFTMKILGNRKQLDKGKDQRPTPRTLVNNMPSV